MVDVDATGIAATVVKDGGIIVEVDLPATNFEGLSFTPDSFEMFVVQDSGSRRFLQYRTFTVFDALTPDLDAGSDSGVFNSDEITMEVKPTFTGTVPENSTVWVYVDGVQKNSHSLSGGSTSYSIPLTTALAEGTYDITIKVGGSSSRVEANRSAASDALEITIDTTAPTISELTVGGAHPDYAIPVGSGA